MIRMLRGYSLKTVAEKSGLSAGYIQKLERGDIKEPSPNKLRGLARALDYPYPKLMELAGYLSEDDRGETDSQGEPSAKDADAQTSALRALDERLGVLLEAVGGAELNESEADFLADALREYRSLRAAGIEPPRDFVGKVLKEYHRLHASSDGEFALDDITPSQAA
ncbi:MAG: helix-turn-helix transcriptional regulator [Gaiellaceae bacterium]